MPAEREPPPPEAEGAAALEQYRTAVRDTTRLNRLFSILSDPAPLRVVVDRVLLALSELFSSDVVALLAAPGAPGAPGAGRAGQLAPLGAIGLPEHLTDRPFAGGEGSYPAAATRDRVPVHVSGARDDARMDPQLRELDVETALWLPIPGSQEVMGVLVLARCHPIPFQSADADLLMAMAYRIGLVLERARAEDERRQLEARLRQAEKTESLGRMAGAVAHHFNNVLTAVMGSLDLALAELPPDHEARSEIARAQAATRQASAMGELMLAYLGQGRQQREPLDLVAACRGALPALAASLPEKVRLRTNLPERTLVASANAANVVQLLTHLVVNAWEAMPGGEGQVVVALRAVPAAQAVASPLLSPGWEPRAETYACLEVSDDGCGMDAAALHRAFDPFFTTKFAGRGLGLPVVLGTVRAHEGAIAVESAPRRGSTFRVFLPLCGEAERGAPTRAERRTSRGASGQSVTLVVDDEPTIRRTSERLLKKAGYEVITAADGVEALEAFGRRAADVSFVVLDLTMPRMDGWDTLAGIRKLRPGTPVILATGYDESQLKGDDHPERPSSFLHKPFSWPDLEAAIEKALTPPA